MNLHFFAVTSEHMIQVPQIKIQHRTPLWRIYFPHFQDRKLNRKDKVKSFFWPVVRQIPFIFTASFTEQLQLARASCHILEEHTAGKEQSEVAPGTQPSHHWGGAKAATGTPPGNPSLSSCQVLYYKCTSQHLCTELNCRGMQTRWELGKPPMSHLRSLLDIWCLYRKVKNHY